MNAIPAAIGAARVPLTNFKTAYTIRKTSTMSAMLRGSLSLPKYSLYGRSKSILDFDFLSDVLRSRFFLNARAFFRSLQKYLVGLRLDALDRLFYLSDGLLYLVCLQLIAQVDVRVDKNLLRREMHRQEFDHFVDVRVALNRALDSGHGLGRRGFTNQQPAR